jgi:hypothetical protein
MKLSPSMNDISDLLNSYFLETIKNELLARALVFRFDIDGSQKIEVV